MTGPVIPLYLMQYYSGGAYKGATYRIVGSETSQIDGENAVYFPYICPSSTLPLGCTILAAQVDSQRIQSSYDRNQ